jgi:gamma-polyglutamate biosynthesis protein CapC
LPLLVETIAIGLVTSLLLAEFFGLSAAGLLVPGYIAFHINNPLLIFIILLATLLTYTSERIVAATTVLFGRRLLSLDVLFSFIWVFLIEQFLMWMGIPIPLILDPLAYFMPALIVMFIGSSGFFNTALSLVLNILIVLIVINLLAIPGWI